MIRNAIVSFSPYSNIVVSAAGFGAAKHLSEQGYSVTLIDASPNPGGLSAGWRTPQGRAMEAGIKGFWYQVCDEANFLLLLQHALPLFASRAVVKQCVCLPGKQSCAMQGNSTWTIPLAHNLMGIIL